jgi:hypothetical protein
MGIEIIDNYGQFHDGKIQQVIINKQESTFEIYLKDVNFDWERLHDEYIPEPGILLFKDVTSYEIIMQDRESWNWITGIEVTELESGYRAEIHVPDDCNHMITIEFGDLELIPIGKENFEFKPPEDLSWFRGELK